MSIYRNNSAGANTLAVQLKGRESNSFGIGALVRLEMESGTQHVRQMMPATGFLSSNLPELHFGLGTEARVKKLTVTWPSGRVQNFENLTAGNRFVIRESADPAPRSSPQIPVKPTPLFAESKALNGLFHREQNYEDFDRQPLLPNKLSQLGPGPRLG